MKAPLKPPPSYSALSEMTREQIIEMYDVVVGQSYTDLGPTTVNLAAKQITDANFYLQEVARRDADEINKQMLRFTKEMRYLTWVIAFLTGVVAVLTIIPLFR